MKAILLKLTVFAFACCMATYLTAQFSDMPNDYLQVRLRTCQQPDNLQLWLANLMNLKTTILLISEDGTVLYENEIDDKAAWGEKLRLDKFLPGTYFVIVQQPATFTSQPFRVEQGVIKIPPLPPPISESKPAKRKEMVDFIQ